MRKVILFALLISSLAVNAQTVLPFGFMDYIHSGSLRNDFNSKANTPGKKWFFSTYSGISTGYFFYNDGAATIVSAPVGLQLNRKINENLYAFAGVSVAPAYMNFNHSFSAYDFNKAYPNNSIFKSNSVGVYQRAELGLMYMNDAKTFSISGSIGVQRGSYPIYPYPQAGRTKQNSNGHLN
jgi:hypothetical protein